MSTFVVIVVIVIVKQFMVQCSNISIKQHLPFNFNFQLQQHRTASDEVDQFSVIKRDLSGHLSFCVMP